MATTIDEIRTFKHRKGQGQRAKGKICSKCGTSHPPRNAQHGARNVTSVAIKTISVHSVGPSSQEQGTENPVAHPEAIRAELSYIVPGLEGSQ